MGMLPMGIDLAYLLSFVWFTPGFIGGIFLIIGAYYVYKGKVLYSVGLYFIADCAWCVIAYQSGDVFGTIVIVTGMLFGLLAFLKMNFGVMRKNLDW